jgi:hypothetical protein
MTVNGQQVFKPYADIVSTHGGAMRIEGIRFFALRGTLEEIAYGWLGEWQLSGTILPMTFVDGVRLRSGNILIGDKNLLSDYFRERRFNVYMVGEVHVTDPKLLPNSRRDNLEDGVLRDEFLASFVREVALPYSRLIRQRSDERSLHRRQEDLVYLLDLGRRIRKYGYIADSQRGDTIHSLDRLCQNTDNASEKASLARLAIQVSKSRHILEVMDGKVTSVLGTDLEPWKMLFDNIYNEIADKKEAEKVLSKALAQLIKPQY